MIHTIVLIDRHHVETLNIDQNGFLWLGYQEFMETLAMNIAKRYKTYLNNTKVDVCAEARVVVTGQYGRVVHTIKINELS